MTALNAETRTLAAALTLAAQRTLPTLSVTITPHTRGKQWLVDRCCNRVWLNSELPREPLLQALREALNVLHQAHRAAASCIPSPRIEAPVYA